MKKVLFILASLLISETANATITFSTAAVANPANPGLYAVVTPPVPVSVGDLVVVTFNGNGNGSGCATEFGTLTSTDNASPPNTFVQVGSFVHVGNFDCTAMLYGYIATANANEAVTVSWSALNKTIVGLVMEDFSGVATSTPWLDVSATGTGSASPLTSGSFTTTNSGDVVVCGVGGYHNNLFTASTIGANTAAIPAAGISGVSGATGGNVAEEYYVESTIQTGITGKMIDGGTVTGGIICAAYFPSGGAPVVQTNPFWFGGM